MTAGAGTTTKAWRTMLFSLLGVLALIATSCGGASSPDSASGSVNDAVSGQTTATATTPTAPAEAEEPGLVATTVNGEQIDFNSLLGQDVVLWFWAPW